MAHSFRCRPRPYQVPRGASRALLRGALNTWLAVSSWIFLSLVEALRRPVLESRAQCQATRRKHFLDFVQALAAEVRRLQQLGLGALDQVADVVDVLCLQAVGGADGEL